MTVEREPSMNMQCNRCKALVVDGSIRSAHDYIQRMLHPSIDVLSKGEKKAFE
jgi:hypothetical protein